MRYLQDLAFDRQAVLGIIAREISSSTGQLGCIFFAMLDRMGKKRVRFVSLVESSGE